MNLALVSLAFPEIESLIPPIGKTHPFLGLILSDPSQLDRLPRYNIINSALRNPVSCCMNGLFITAEASSSSFGRKRHQFYLKDSFGEENVLLPCSITLQVGLSYLEAGRMSCDLPGIPEGRL